MAQSLGSVDVYRQASGTITNYGSLTEALSSQPALVAGDVVAVRGIVDQSLGVPIAYSETTTNESFPLVVPSGVTVRTQGPDPVYVATVASGPVTLMALDPSGGAPAPTTRIEGLRFQGAETALRVGTTQASESLDVVISDVRFGRNENGLWVEAAPGQITVRVEDCWVADEVPVSQPVVAPRKFSRGLVFHAHEAGVTANPGDVDATVVDLRTLGLFLSGQMLPVDYARPSFHDLEPYGSKITRLIEVFAEGSSSEGEHVWAGTYYEVLPIPTVRLTVNGSTLDGKGYQAGAGWDVGLYLDTNSGQALPILDYAAAWHVETNGTTLRNFGAAGVYGESWLETRGMLQMHTSTVEDTGYTATPAPLGFLRSGVHLVTHESYIAFGATDCEFSDNVGNGVYAMTENSILANDMDFPTGLYVDVRDSGFHGNGGSGLFLDGSPDKGQSGFQGGIVGGTYDFYLGPDPIRNQPMHAMAPLLVGEDGIQADGRLPDGQGVAEACGFSNNGAYGIRVRLRGGSLTGTGSRGFASMRFVDDYVWNNALGGYRADLSPAPGNDTNPYLLTPIVHSTFADNAGWSVEVVPFHPGSGNTVTRFYWQDETGAQNFLVTSLFHSVFQRQNPGTDDFGPELVNLLVWDDGAQGDWWGQEDRIGWASIRAHYGAISNTTSWSTQDSAPFLGPFDPASRDWRRYSMDEAQMGNHPAFFKSGDYLHAGRDLSEDHDDIEGVSRQPMPTHTRDLGGEEG